MFSTLRKSKRIVYLFITAAMILGMGFFGMTSAMNSMGKKNGAVAVVNGEPVSAQEMAERVDSQQRRIRQMLGDQADAFMPQLNIEGQVLDQLIKEKVSLVEAGRLRVSVSDAELIEYVAGLPGFQKDGAFDVEGYEKIPNRGVMESNIRSDMTNNKFQTYISERVRLTPAEIRHNYLLKETKVEVSYAQIKLDALGAKAKPTPEEVKAALADRPALEAYYQEKQSEFTVPASARFKQIRVGVPFQASAEQKALARKKIEAIRDSINETNFVEVARTKSDDEYAAKGGAVDWTVINNLDKSLQAAIEKLDPGQRSPIIETSFAFYVIQLDEKKPAVVQPLDVAEGAAKNGIKAVIAEKVATRRAAQAAAAKTQKAWEQRLAEGKSLEPELKQAGIELKKTGPFSLGEGNVPNIGKADEVLDAVFTLTMEKPVYPKLVRVLGDLYYIKLLSVARANESELKKNPDAFEKSLVGPLQGEIQSSWLEDARKKTQIVQLIQVRGAATAGMAPIE